MATPLASRMLSPACRRTCSIAQQPPCLKTKLLNALSNQRTPPIIPRAPLQHTRYFSSSTLRRAPRYIRYEVPPRQSGGSQSNWFVRWVTSRGFYYQIGGAGALAGVVWIANLEVVPISGRRRFNIVSEDMVLKTSAQAYHEVLSQFQGQIVPPSHPSHRLVERVLRRLIPHIPESLPVTDWTVNVVNSPEPNAFVLPGGHVFVLSGILPICETEDGLAAVLGHEIAHNIAGHVAEKMTRSGILTGLSFVLDAAVIFLTGVSVPGLTRTAIDLGLSRPNSRTQESEADYIGLLMMSEACYDPRAAVGLWQRMEEAGQQVPQFLSTHPASHNRMVAIQGWLPKAEAKRQESGCATLKHYSNAFSQTYRRSL